MPPEISKEVVSLLQYLLPGFLVGWVFYGLTSHQKPPQFERVIQALIFSLGVQVLVIIERAIAAYLTRWATLGSWTADSELIASILSALVLGAVTAHIANKDILHGMLRKFRLSSRSAHSSEWYIAFSERQRYVVLHLKDERRLFGWPTAWPSDPEKGFFIMDQPEWLEAPAGQSDQTECMVVNVTDVKWVEFIKKP
ncbi:DUF6338 family protein [Noviherbaspirillum sp. CPCC 100848]|uniref:DUF6338 family protein n=1 Tax=Noviherbaspirillum album TaxID=3080276 RepID=A0ABU6JH18_9BURK|nr:DUF6338 family protein [Noviherbaspirillum sp. CPCC 100848]MEC4722766.1 DUF6338 family protein [Noviherbaspirillum sp. CPCC 100848]